MNAIAMPDIEAQKLLAQQLQIRQDAEKQLEDAMEAENGAEKLTCIVYYSIIGHTISYDIIWIIWLDESWWISMNIDGF